MHPQRGSLQILGHYRLLGKRLGKGNYATVEEAVQLELGVHVAIKIIDTSKVTDQYVKRNLHREANLMRRLRHPHVLAFFQAMEAGSLYCLVTELVEGGELSCYVDSRPNGHLDEQTTLMFGSQLISAVSHMHKKGIVHRDIKMKNIMLTKTQDAVKIVDYGLSNEWSAQNPLLTHCGSPGYAAPEIYKGRAYGPEVDLWSLGVVLYGMAVGQMPFNPAANDAMSKRDRQRRLLDRMLKGVTDEHMQAMEHFSKPFRDLVQGLLTPDARLRITMAQVLNHPWVANRLRARHLLNPQYNLHAREHSLILAKLAELLKLPSASVAAGNRVDGNGQVATLYNILAHKQLSSNQAAWSFRPLSCSGLDPPPVRLNKPSTIRKEETDVNPEAPEPALNKKDAETAPSQTQPTSTTPITIQQFAGSESTETGENGGLSTMPLQCDPCPWPHGSSGKPCGIERPLAEEALPEPEPSPGGRGRSEVEAKGSDQSSLHTEMPQQIKQMTAKNDDRFRGLSIPIQPTETPPAWKKLPISAPQTPLPIVVCKSPPRKEKHPSQSYEKRSQATETDAIQVNPLQTITRAVCISREFKTDPGTGQDSAASTLVKSPSKDSCNNAIFPDSTENKSSPNPLEGEKYPLPFVLPYKKVKSVSFSVLDTHFQQSKEPISVAEDVILETEDSSTCTDSLIATNQDEPDTISAFSDNESGSEILNENSSNEKTEDKEHINSLSNVGILQNNRIPEKSDSMKQPQNAEVSSVKYSLWRHFGSDPKKAIPLLVKTTPVLRKMSPEPKKTLQLPKRLSCLSPTSLFRHFKTHPKLSKTYLVTCQTAHDLRDENMISKQNNEEENEKIRNETDLAHDKSIIQKNMYKEDLKFGENAPISATHLLSEPAMPQYRESTFQLLNIWPYLDTDLTINTLEVVHSKYKCGDSKAVTESSKKVKKENKKNEINKEKRRNRKPRIKINRWKKTNCRKGISIRRYEMDYMLQKTLEKRSTSRKPKKKASLMKGCDESKTIGQNRKPEKQITCNTELSHVNKRDTEKIFQVKKSYMYFYSKFSKANP